jgi:DDE superfamily endonuclease/Helix-turn-helix of DDE superfamily endonuclease
MELQEEKRSNNRLLQELQGEKRTNNQLLQELQEEKRTNNQLLQNHKSEKEVLVKEISDQAKQIAECTELKDQLNFYKKFERDAVILKLQLSEAQKKLRLMPATPEIIPQPFEIERVKNWDQDILSSFTGLQEMGSLDLLVEILKSKGINYTNSYEPRKVNLTKQVLIFLIKVRTNLTHEALGYLFQVSTYSVSIIVNSILDAIFELYYTGKGPLSLIPSREKNCLHLPKCFQDIQNCRIVIDCTEFTTEVPSQLALKKVAYSHYKSRHTMKVLIGCAPNGTATFVSELYGGSESDKSIVFKSGILNQLVPGDLVLADKGFTIFDILPDGVALNIPSFLVGKQFTPNEMFSNKINTRARVIIERFNARLKIFKILDCINAKNRQKADKIVKVCVALTTLMPTLMKELNEVLE